MQGFIEGSTSLSTEAEQTTNQAERPQRSDFARIYAEHRGPVFGYLRARLLDANDAEDSCQEVFLRAYGALDRFDPEEGRGLRPWLLGIARNVLRETVRKRVRRKEVMWTELCMELETMLGGPEGMYEDVLHLLPKCMGSLSESAGDALKWHYMGGMKLQQIADKMDRTLGAVKVLMVRARKALKRCINAQLAREKHAT